MKVGQSHEYACESCEWTGLSQLLSSPFTYRVSNIAHGSGFSGWSNWSSGTRSAAPTPHALLAFLALLALGPIGTGEAIKSAGLSDLSGQSRQSGCSRFARLTLCAAGPVCTFVTLFFGGKISVRKERKLCEMIYGLKYVGIHVPRGGIKEHRQIHTCIYIGVYACGSLEAATAVLSPNLAVKLNFKRFVDFRKKKIQFKLILKSNQFRNPTLTHAGHTRTEKFMQCLVTSPKTQNHIPFSGQGGPFVEICFLPSTQFIPSVVFHIISALNGSP